jgi:maltose alpha-D-glucosyltransferase/alpha-amylase
MPFVIQTKGPDIRSRERYELLREFREFLQWRRGDAIILAEANVEPKNSMHYFGDDGERLQMMFNFWVNQRTFHALATGDSRPLVKALEQTREHPPTGQWGHFLRNHDELDLGRLTDSQRQAVFDALGPDKNMQLYDRGIRRRLAPMLSGDRRRLELAYSLMFTLPGTPVIRYGDELGMGDDLSLPERNCARTPMQWSTEPQAGFTRASKPVLPVIEHGPYGFHKINAADQRRDPESLLNWTERIIRMRKEVPELGWGDFTVLETGHDGVLALRYDWRNNAVVTLHNLTGETTEIKLRVGDPRGRQLINLLTQDHSQADGRGQHHIVLEPYGYHWYRAGGLGYLLDRTSA